MRMHACADALGLFRAYPSEYARSLLILAYIEGLRLASTTHLATQLEMCHSFILS